MDAQQDDTNLVKRASDARERRKLQNRVAQRNFRRRQALKEKQQEREQSQTSGRNPDRRSPLLPDVSLQGGTPRNDERTKDKASENVSAGEYPAIPPLPSPENDPQSMSCPPPTLLADPISPASFPLLCSPGDLWIDRPSDEPRAGGAEPFPSLFSNEMPTMPSHPTPHSVGPFIKHSSGETTTTVASPDARRSSVTKKRLLPFDQGGQCQKISSRHLSAPTPIHYLSTPPDTSMSICEATPDPVAGGKTTLHICAERGHANVLQFLLSYGAEIDATDSLGRTALHYAAMKGHVDSVCVLLERGAETEMADEFGLNPLHIAAQLGHEAVVRMLVSEGADLNARIGSRALSQP